MSTPGHPAPCISSSCMTGGMENLPSCAHYFPFEGDSFAIKGEGAIPAIMEMRILSLADPPLPLIHLSLISRDFPSNLPENSFPRPASCIALVTGESGASPSFGYPVYEFPVPGGKRTQMTLSGFFSSLFPSRVHCITFLYPFTPPDPCISVPPPSPLPASRYYQKLFETSLSTRPVNLF